MPLITAPGVETGELIEFKLNLVYVLSCRTAYVEIKCLTIKNKTKLARNSSYCRKAPQNNVP